MPWLETDVQEQRIVFVVEALHPAANRRGLPRSLLKFSGGSADN